MLRISTIMMIAFMTLIMMGCGQKGPLYLPDETTQTKVEN